MARISLIGQLLSMLPSLPRSRVLAAAVAVSLPSAAKGWAQERTTIVRITVIESDSVRLAGVNLAISRADVGAILAGRTNTSGEHLFRVPLSKDKYMVLARFPGFAPTESPFNSAQGDTIDLIMRLERVPATQLAPVAVEVSSSRYVLDASRIAESNRQIRDAFEALRKLKPSMLYDRDRCKGEVVENVWINGRRVLFMASNVPILGKGATRTVGPMKIRTIGGGARSEPPAVDSVLASVRAEHVGEIRLVNCWDTSLPGVGANNALYVTLKPGVDWDWKRGSFVPDSSGLRRK
jgi:hypothetical protein